MNKNNQIPIITHFHSISNRSTESYPTYQIVPAFLLVSLQSLFFKII